VDTERSQDTGEGGVHVGRRKFSREFKVEAVRMVTVGGHEVGEVSRDLGIRPDMLRKWMRQVEEDGQGAFPGTGHQRSRGAEDEELRRLRRKLRDVEEERDILKKALAIFSERRR